MVQGPLGVMVGVVIPVVVVATVNVDPYTAVGGAPVKVTVGVAISTVTGTVSVTCALSRPVAVTTIGPAAIVIGALNDTRFGSAGVAAGLNPTCCPLIVMLLICVPPANPVTVNCPFGEVALGCGVVTV